MTEATTPYPMLTAKLNAEPWQILGETHAGLQQALADHVRSGQPLDRSGLAPAPEDKKWKTRGVEISQAHGVAVIPVDGVLGKRLHWMEAMCGGTDLLNIDQDIETVEKEHGISHIIFEMNTPGGLALPTTETAERIEELSASINPATGQKRTTIAYTDSLMASAGYKLAAACDEIYAAKSAVIGSISTFIAMVDDSKAWAKAGKERKLFRRGKFKAAGMSGKPFTEEEETLFTEQVKLLDTEFKQYIRDRRGVKLRDLNALEGQTFTGSDALAMGLVDGHFRSLRDLVAEVIDQNRSY